MYLICCIYLLLGKNALHLASRNGHSLCVQKLLQVKCGFPHSVPLAPLIHE